MGFGLETFINWVQFVTMSSRIIFCVAAILVVVNLQLVYGMLGGLTPTTDATNSCDCFGGSRGGEGKWQN